MIPTFSIIIPAHNEENYIRKTLHSIKNQSYQNFETIIVANGCTDKTEEIVKKRANENLKLISLSTPNVSAARNAGALNAIGEILLFLDADTALEVDSLKKIKEQFSLKYSVATTKVKPDNHKIKYKIAMWFKNFYNSTKIYQGCGGALICRKEDFHKVQGYDPEIIVKEHRILTIKLKKLGKYGCMDTTVTTSMRRFERWGLSKATLFWLKEWTKAWIGDLSKSKYEKIR
ncbi:MAG: glycosyltransferase [Nanoarchaeota archaeon]|nr:glycosyltransferase [Nanoarchaeota archaeon]MBU1644394.1 glycosyltransferase [Nanoarchaeota archaeon]MBU1976419.1 glycosyltransferase [Nanoarchaeota archaeon]